MSDPDLDKLLRSYAQRATPELYGNLQDKVWQQIRHRRQAREPFLDRLSTLVWRTHFAAASVIAAVAIGVGLAWREQNADTAENASRALNLKVFSEQPPTLPLTSSSW